MDIDYNALGQVIDTSWGRSSTPLTTQFSVKIKLVGAGMINVSYAAVVNFASERQMVDMKRRYASEAGSVIAAQLRAIRAAYKDLTGETIKFSEAGSSDSVELTSMGVYNPKRTGLYRRVDLYEIG